MARPNDAEFDALLLAPGEEWPFTVEIIARHGLLPDPSMLWATNASPFRFN